MKKQFLDRKKVLQELQKRSKEQNKDKINFDLSKFCFDTQLKFVSDKSRFKTAVCSRRAGKTVGIAADLVYTCLKNSRVNCLYITLNRRTAHAIIWQDLKSILEDYEIDCKLNETTLTIEFSNKSKIYVAGAKDQTEVEKFRGWKLKKVYIDEAQSFRPYIKYFIDDVLLPALRDHRGSLAITGTPGPILAGPFYEYSHSSGWSHHKWTAFDNPYMHSPPERDLEETLKEERAMKGIDEHDPGYIRETYGEWVEDENSLVFKYNKSLNNYEEIPKGSVRYVVGVDIGYEDSDAIAVLAYHEQHKRVYLVDEIIQNKQTISMLVDQVKFIRDKYDPVKIVMDAGALGKKIQEEILQRHSLHMDAAEKHRKVEFIELLNDDLRTEKLFAKKDSRFAEDCMLVQWDLESRYKNPENPKISDAYHSDITDAVLYAWRECKHFGSEKPEKSPHKDSKEYMKKYWEEKAAQIEKRKNQEWWEQYDDDDYSDFDY